MGGLVQQPAAAGADRRHPAGRIRNALLARNRQNRYSWRQTSESPLNPGRFSQRFESSSTRPLKQPAMRWRRLALGSWSGTGNYRTQRLDAGLPMMRWPGVGQQCQGGLPRSLSEAASHYDSGYPRRTGDCQLVSTPVNGTAWQQIKRLQDDWLRVQELSK